MKAVVVIESAFGNVQHVGESIAAGLASCGWQTQVVGINDAPAQIPADTDLLLAGAPTHNRTLSTATTRKLAAAEGGIENLTGIREWLESAAIPERASVTIFDTASGHGWLNGSAARTAAKLMNQRFPDLEIACRTFVVQHAKGPLAPGELEAAHEWGRELATSRRRPD